MSEFLDSIKITDDDKKEAMARMLFIMLHSTDILSLNEISEAEKINRKTLDKLEFEEDIKEKLNENEMLATYSLAREAKISILSSSNRNRKLLDYLELGTGSVNRDKLQTFINQAVKDIEALKRNNPKVKWRLQVNKIFSRLEGIDPTIGEVLGCESENNPNIAPSKPRRVSDKIIKIPGNYLGEEKA